MTVSPLKQSKIASTALALLDREIVLPNVITVGNGGEFKFALDDTVTIRVPARTKAKRRDLRPATENDRTIQLSDLEEQSIQVKLEYNIYNAIGIEDEVATLDIADFGTQVLNPQVRAVSVDWENLIAEEIVNAPYTNTVVFDPDKPYHSVVRANRLLGDAFVPRDGRTLLIGAGVEEALQTSGQYINASSSGDAVAGNALQEATLGFKVAGYNPVVSYAIPENKAYLFHRSAFSAAVVAPIIPKGAVYGKSINGVNGLALTWLQDYDALQSRDRSIVHFYAGTNHTIDPADENADNAKVAAGGFLRAVELTLPGSGS